VDQVIKKYKYYSLDHFKVTSSTGMAPF